MKVLIDVQTESPTSRWKPLPNVPQIEHLRRSTNKLVDRSSKKLCGSLGRGLLRFLLG